MNLVELRQGEEEATCCTGALTSCVALSTLGGVAAVGPAVVDAGRPLKCTGGFRVWVESPLAVVVVLSFLTASFI